MDYGLESIDFVKYTLNANIYALRIQNIFIFQIDAPFWTRTIFICFYL